MSGQFDSQTIFLFYTYKEKEYVSHVVNSVGFSDWILNLFEKKSVINMYFFL